MENVSLFSDKLYLLWLFIVSIAFTYNAVCLTLRGMFRQAKIHLDEEEIAERNLGFVQNCMNVFYVNGKSAIFNQWMDMGLVGFENRNEQVITIFNYNAH